MSMFEARIRAIRSTAGRKKPAPRTGIRWRISCYRTWLRQDGIVGTIWWMLWRRFVSKGYGKNDPAKAMGMNPKAEVLRALRTRSRS